ncbi:MAG: hypothetical protein RL226_1770 [Bacteroidota bacterium]
MGSDLADFRMLQARESGYVHAEKVHVFIAELMKTAKPDAVAISRGPGSYTGLRIGTAAAKGVCYALNIPLIAIDTTEVLAYAAFRGSSGLNATVLLDARRMEVYTASYKLEQGKLIQTAPVRSCEVTENTFQEPAIYIGDGAEKCRSLLPANSSIVQAEPEALDLFTAALEKASLAEFADVAYFEPYYLKEFVAGTPKNVL